MVRTWYKLSFGIVLIVIIFLLSSFDVKAKDQKDNNTIIYFYSTTCSSCVEINKYLDNLHSNNKLSIIKYNISQFENMGLLNTYCKKYNVDDDSYGMVPIIFIGNKYLFGKEIIKKGLDEVVKSNNNFNTKILNETTYDSNIKIFKTLNIGTVFLAGLINGLNPCSLSMLFFLLSLLVTKYKNKIVSYGIAFISSKFITFYFLGLLFFLY